MGFALCHALWNIFVVGIGVGGEHALPVFSDDCYADIRAARVNAAHQRLCVGGGGVFQPNGERLLPYHHGIMGFKKNTDIAVVLRRHQRNAVFSEHVNHVHASFREK